MFVIVERSYGVVEKFSRLGWHAVSINFMYWFSLVGKNMPPLFSVLSFVLCFECNIFGATLYVHRCITVQLTFFCEKHLKYQIFFNKYKSSLSKNI